MDFLIFIIGLLFGSGFIFLLLYKKLKKQTQLDIQTKQQNEQLKQNKKYLEEDLKALQVNIAEQQVEYQKCLTKKSELLNSIDDLKEQANKASKVFYEQSINLTKQQIKETTEQLKCNFLKTKEDLNNEYLELLKDNMLQFQEKIEKKHQELLILDEKINKLSIDIKSAVEANKRAFEMQEKQNYYKLIIPNEDIEEIKKLKEVLPYLKDEEALCKVIWKVYYEKPYSDLVGRVVGSGVHCGIYKITNLTNQMCYVGQAVDISARWRQHIKRGLGAETATRNKLYPAMKEYGPENFSFEIIEECSRQDLDSREDYWQNYFGAKEFGYSIK